ncbi:zinc ribbon domain-containing protein [Kocuria rhizophila]|nr:zinc ribbon domain-containing protein [Kocuria rhizophila]
MPVYEFRCEACGCSTRHHAMARCHAPRTAPCGADARRVFSAVGLSARTLPGHARSTARPARLTRRRRPLPPRLPAGAPAAAPP